MEKSFACLLDRNEVYDKKPYELQISIKNITDSPWKVTKDHCLSIAIPLGRSDTALAKSDQGIQLNCSALKTEKEASEEGVWNLYAEEEEYEIMPDETLLVQLFGPEPYFPKSGTSYMSGILFAYPQDDNTEQREYLPVFKAEDHLDILFFSVKGKERKADGSYEVVFGEEITLCWEFTGEQGYQVQPYGWNESGKREKTIVIWQDMVFSLRIWNQETQIQRDISIKTIPPGSVEKVKIEKKPEGISVITELKNSGYVYVSRGVGRIKSQTVLTEYDPGEYYFLEFPGGKRMEGNFQIESEPKDPRPPRLSSFFYMAKKKGETYHYIFKWSTEGSDGNTYIEKEGVETRYEEKGEITFTSGSIPVTLNLRIKNKKGSELVVHDIYPNEAKCF